MRVLDFRHFLTGFCRFLAQENDQKPKAHGIRATLGCSTRSSAKKPGDDPWPWKNCGANRLSKLKIFRLYLILVIYIYIYMSKFRTHPSSSQQFLVRVFHHSTSSHFPKGLCQLSLSHAFLAMALHPSFEGVQWPDPSSRKGCLISILLFLLVATIIASILIIIGSFSLNWCLLLLV